MRDFGQSTDGLLAQYDRARDTNDLIIIEGLVTAQWFDESGRLYHESVQHNLITSAGDNYYVGRAVLASGLPSQVTGMKLGTGTTAPSKSGAGAALVTYIAGSNKTFDATFPSVAANVATFKRTFAAGEGTSATAIAECVIVNDAATDATSSVANTISRALFGSPAAKAAADALVVTWTHTFTGA